MLLTGTTSTLMKKIGSSLTIAIKLAWGRLFVRQSQLNLHLRWFCSNPRVNFFSFEWQSWQNANKFNVPCTTRSPESISRKWWWFSKLVEKGRVILALMHSAISSCLLELFMCVLQFLNWEHQRHLCQWEVKDLVAHSRRKLRRASSSRWINMPNPPPKSQSLAVRHTWI